MTHTFALLEVTDDAYDEIAAKLKDAGYDHAFVETEHEGRDTVALDLHGVALVCRVDREQPDPDDTSPWALPS